MLRVFITGGEGMVGKNLLDRLSNGKFKVFSPKRNELDLLNKDSISFYLKKTRGSHLKKTDPAMRGKFGASTHNFFHTYLYNI